MTADIVFELPGALIRWLIGKILQKNKPIYDYMNEDGIRNFFAGFCLWFFSILAYNIIKWKMFGVAF